jgi:hypothetical protein
LTVTRWHLAHPIGLFAPNIPTFLLADPTQITLVLVAAGSRGIGVVAMVRCMLVPIVVVMVSMTPMPVGFTQGGFSEIPFAMMVEMEGPQEEEHHHHPDHHRPGDLIDPLRTYLHQRVGQQMKDRDAQHQSTDVADDHLHPHVGEANQGWQPAPQQGSRTDRHAVTGQQEERRGIGGWGSIVHGESFSPGKSPTCRSLSSANSGKGSGLCPGQPQSFPEKNDLDARISIDEWKGPDLT